MIAQLAYSPWGRIPSASNQRVLPSASAVPASEAGTAVTVSEHAAVALQLIAAYHGCDIGHAVEKAAFAHADQIGVPALLDAQEVRQGRAAVARLAHNQEVASSNLAPATSSDFAHGRTGASRLACAGAADDGRAAVAASDLRSGEPPP